MIKVKGKLFIMNSWNNQLADVNPFGMQMSYMQSTSAGMLLYALMHNLFALQYIRASLTVPLHFERRRRLDGNYVGMLDSIDKKIICRQRLIFGL